MQSRLGLVVNSLPHQDDAAQILRLRQIGLARIDRVQLFQRLREIIGVEFAKRLVVHRLQFRFGRRHIVRRERTENQERDRRDFPNLHGQRRIEPLLAGE